MLPLDRKKFYRRASMGVSGNIVKLERGAELPTQLTGPDSVTISFAKANLVYLPRKSRIEISAANAVVSYCEGWQKKN